MSGYLRPGCFLKEKKYGSLNVGRRRPFFYASITIMGAGVLGLFFPKKSEPQTMTKTRPQDPPEKHP